MKKTQSRTVRLFANIFVTCILFIGGSLHGQTGGACTSAIPVFIDASVPYTGTINQSQEQWFEFVAFSSGARVVVTNTAPLVASINMLDCYFGGCSYLYPFSGPVHNTTVRDSLVMNLEGLNAGETYWIKLSRTSACSSCNTTSAAPFTLKVVTLAVVPVVCSCSSLFPPTTINTCEAVCNGNFDLYNTAGQGLFGHGQIQRACPWQQPIISPSTITPSPDLYNDTNQNAGFNVPANTYGYQNSATTSPAPGFSGYAGIFCYVSTDANVREYISTGLNYTLTNNKRYRVTFKISLADNSAFAVKNIGAYLTNGQPTQSNNSTLNIPVANLKARTTTQTTNALVWTTVSDTFTATGNLNWLTIGQMTDDAGASPVAVTPAVPGIQYVGVSAYYYIDSVSIVPDVPVEVVASPSPVCNGDTVMAIAYDSGGVGNYTWTTTPSSTITCEGTSDCDTINSVPPGTSNSIYFATTTLTGYGNCTVTRSDTVVWLPGPLVVDAGTDNTICLGGSDTLLGGATGTWWNRGTWSTLNNTTLCNNCTTFVVNPTTTTEYVFTATNDTTGCFRKDTVKITVQQLVVTIVSPPGATVCSGCFDFNTAISYSSYSWSTNAVTSSGGSTSTLNACWGAPYDTSGLSGNVSVSVTDAQGCQGSAYLSVPSCCPYKEGQFGAYPNLINDSTSHVDNVTYPFLFTYNAANTYYEATNQQFSINGLFVVDRNTRLLGCEVKLGPNAKIIIRPGIKFELTNASGGNFTKLYACTDMWDGIYVNGTNSASKVTVLNGTVIEDAKNAIVSTNGGNFFIDGGTNWYCKFNKNNIGVLIKTYTGAHPGVIRKTIFSCDAPGQPGSTSGVTFSGANCRAPVSGKGYAGVYVENCANVTIGDSSVSTYRNLFERTHFGVYSTGSNVKVWNNDFKYFTTTYAGKNLPLDGIAVYAKAAKFVPKNLTVGRVGNYKAKNKFTHCSYGVYAHNYMNLSCEYNRFDSCSQIGVAVTNCLSNTILINQDTLTECTGTNICCQQVANSTVTITYNSINNTQNFVNSNYGQTGILVNNAILTNVTLNIQFNSIKKMRNGIWVSRVQGARITDNSPINFMTGQPMSQGSPCVGIKLEEVTNSMIRQNGVAWQTTPTLAKHDEVFGIHMTNCKNDTVTKNTFLRMGSAIFLRGANNPCILACNSMTTCWFGVNFNFLNANGVAVSVNDQITWTSANTPYATGNGWGGGSLGSDLKGVIMPISGNGIKWYYPSAGYNPSTSMSPFSLYNGVTQSTTNGDRCSYMLAPPAQTPAGIRDNTLAGICKTPRTYDTLNAEYQYHDNVYAYRMLRQNPSWKSLGTEDDSYYSNFYTAQSSTNIGKFADVEDSITSGGITAASTLLSAITPSGQYEINRKALLEVYLGSWAIDSMNLDSAQEAILLNIIHQGTLTGGTTVFDARNMLRLEVHDSSVARIQCPIYTATQPNINSPVYPNPSSGQFSIDIALTENVPGVFELYDLTGRLVGSWQFIGGQGKYTFDASFLPSGTYIYRAGAAGEMLKSDRLIIIKE